MSASSQRAPSLAAPAILLAGELAFVSPFVEFEEGPMAWVADGRFCLGLLTAAAAFVLLGSTVWGDLRRSLNRRTWQESSLWCLSHLVCFPAFFGASLLLHHTGGPHPWWHALVWSALSLGSAVSAVLIFLCPSAIWRILQSTWHLLPASLLIGTLTFAGTSLIRMTWPATCWPTIESVAWLLDRYPGKEVVNYSLEGLPVIGTRDVPVRITPSCSEMESFLVFGLLCLALVLGRRSWSWKGWIARVFAGVLVLQLINTLRLYGLIVVGVLAAPEWTVRLAHSRLGAIVWLAACLAILWQGPPRQPDNRYQPSEK